MLSKIKTIHSRIFPQPEKLVKTLDYCALWLYALFIFGAFMRSTTFVIDWHPIYLLLLRTILILLVITKSLVKLTDKLPAYIALLFCSIGYALGYIHSGSTILLEIILFIILLMDIDFRKLIAVYITVIGASLIVVFVASNLSILNHLSYTTDSGAVRNSFGVNYPTDFAAYILFFCLAWAYYRKEKITYIEIGVFYGLAYFIWHYCIARTSTLCLIVLSTFLLIYKTLILICKKNAIKPWGRHANILSFPLTLAIPICSIFAIVSAYYFNAGNPLHQKLNSLLSGRLELGSSTFKHYDVTLFGQSIDMYGNGGYTFPWFNFTAEGALGYNFIDSSYLNILFRFGLFVFLCTMLLFWLASISARKRQDYITLFILAILAVHCLIEHHMLDLQYNPFIFIFLASHTNTAKTADNEAKTANTLSKKSIITFAVYILLSCVILFSDKKEPKHIVFDIAAPVKTDQETTDTSAADIAPLVSYSDIQNYYGTVGQIIYTPKIITGIELWLQCKDTVNLEYTITFYAPETGQSIFSETFSSADIVRDGFTRIIFTNGHTLPEGASYYYCISTSNYNESTLMLGIIPRNSSWSGNLFIYGTPVPEQTLCYNLVYDYQNWGFINWIVLTIICIFTLVYIRSRKFTLYKQPVITTALISFTMLILILIFVHGYAYLIFPAI